MIRVSLAKAGYGEYDNDRNGPAFATASLPITVRPPNISVALAVSSRAVDEGPPVDEREFDHMRAWRLERAEGKPAYTVATDTVLREVLRKRPRNTGELLEIKGIGVAKCEKYGASMLAALGEL